jgi:hypothetical protein
MIRGYTAEGREIIELTCIAFSGETRKPNRMIVNADGDVEVWRESFGCYTTAHRLSSHTIATARRWAGFGK